MSRGIRNATRVISSSSADAETGAQSPRCRHRRTRPIQSVDTRTCWLEQETLRTNRRIVRNAHEQLAEVPAVQQADERLRRGIQPLDNVLPVTKLTAAQPRAALVEEC